LSGADDGAAAESTDKVTLDTIWSFVDKLADNSDNDGVCEFPTGIWRLQKFRDLGESDKCLAFYLMTTPHLTAEQRTSGGPYNLPRQYVAGDLDWTDDNVLSRVQQSGGLFSFDDKRQEFGLNFAALLPDQAEEQAA